MFTHIRRWSTGDERLFAFLVGLATFESTKTECGDAVIASAPFKQPSGEASPTVRLQRSGARRRSVTLRHLRSSSIAHSECAAAGLAPLKWALFGASASCVV